MMEKKPEQANHHCPMCGSLWNGKKCKVCQWKESK